MGGTDHKCPVCRTTFTGCTAIPDLFEHPERWFATIDFDGDKALSRQEITDVLKCYFDVDPKALEQHIEKNRPSPPPMAPPAYSAQAPLPLGWEQRWTQDGKPYFVNR